MVSNMCKSTSTTISGWRWSPFVHGARGALRCHGKICVLLVNEAAGINHRTWLTSYLLSCPSGERSSKACHFPLEFESPIVNQLSITLLKDVCHSQLWSVQQDTQLASTRCRRSFFLLHVGSGARGIAILLGKSAEVFFTRLIPSVHGRPPRPPHHSGGTRWGHLWHATLLRGSSLWGSIPHPLQKLGIGTLHSNSPVFNQGCEKPQSCCGTPKKTHIKKWSSHWDSPSGFPSQWENKKNHEKIQETWPPLAPLVS